MHDEGEMCFEKSTVSHDFSAKRCEKSYRCTRISAVHPLTMICSRDTRAGFSSGKSFQFAAIGLFKMFYDGYGAITINYHVPNVEVGATRHAQTFKKKPLLENANKISLRLVLLNVYQSVATPRMDHNQTYKYQVSL